MTLQLTSDRGPSRTFKFEVVRDQLFTPLMTYSALLKTLGAVRAAVRHGHLRASRARRRSKDHGRSPSRISFPATIVAHARVGYIVAPLTALIANDDEPVEVERLDLTIRSMEEPRTATLERVWIDDPRPRAGRTVPLKVLLRTYRGEDMLRTIPIAIPANATGTCR